MAYKIATVLAVLAALFLAGVGTLAVMPACESEDSTNCVWDATEQGNGQGRSFVDIGGQVIYLP